MKGCDLCALTFLCMFQTPLFGALVWTKILENTIVFWLSDVGHRHDFWRVNY